MALTKKQVNEELNPVYNIYALKIPDRYHGLTKNDCKTDIQLIFWNVVTSSDFEYENKKTQFNEVYKRLGLPVGEHKEFKKVTDSGVIIRNLPANDKYKLIGSGSFAEMEGWFCENCGRYITHWNEVQNTEGKKFLVGSECINTVLKYDATKDWDTWQLISEANKRKNNRAKLLKILKNGGYIEHCENKYIRVYNLHKNYCGSISEENYNLMFRKGIKKQS
jgi:hypothetical protein